MQPLSPVATLGLPPAVRNFRAQDAYEPFAALLTFALEWMAAADDYRVGIYLDGELVQILPPDATEATITGLFNSRNARIDAVAFPIWEPPPDMHGHFGSDSAYVVWPFDDTADLAAFDVYRAVAVTPIGGGGNELVSPVLLGRVETKQVIQKIYARPDSGEAHGRITAWGSVPNEHANGSFALTVTGAGEISWSGFGDSGTMDFEKGTVLQLPGGVLVQFNDRADDYVEDDVYTINVGVPNFYQTDTLAEGTYYFGRVAVDNAGNESTGPIRATTAVKIQYEPGPVSAPSIEYAAAGNGTVTLSWTDPADLDLDGVRIYSNYDPVVGVLDDYIYEIHPLAEIAPGVETYSLPNLEDLTGIIRFYIRPVDADGLENESIGMLTMNLPPTAEELGLILGNVSLLEASPAAGGDVLATWVYVYQRGDDCTGFAYWLGEDEPDFSDPPTGTIASTSNKRRVQFFEHTFDTNAATDTVLYLAIRATDGDGNYGTPETFVTVTADAEAPEMDTDPQAVTN